MPINAYSDGTLKTGTENVTRTKGGGVGNYAEPFTLHQGWDWDQEWDQDKWRTTPFCTLPRPYL